MLGLDGLICYGHFRTRTPLLQWDSLLPRPQNNATETAVDNRRLEQQLSVALSGGHFAPGPQTCTLRSQVTDDEFNTGDA
jgi:hypothetical protein